MLRQLATAAALTLAAPALAQTTTVTQVPGTAPPPSGSTVVVNPPAQPPAVAQPPASTAVTVNPPASPPPAAPPPSTTAVTVNPPAAPPPPPTVVAPPPPAQVQVVQAPPATIEQRVESRSALGYVLVDAAYGGAAGLLVGAGVTLLEQGGHWERNLSIGAGAGILVGAVIGGIQAYSASVPPARVARDGLGSPDRDPPLASAGVQVLGYGGRF